MAAPEFLIRPESPADYEAISTVVAAAFKSPVEARLVDDIRASVYYRPEMALVALLGGQLVGHVMISGTDLHDGDRVRVIAMLSPLAVAPECHGQGIGSALVRAVTKLADDAGEPLVVLAGSPVFYGRLGFEWSVPQGITLPVEGWAPPEGAQLLRLRAYDPSIRGRVVYPPAFDEASEPS